MKEVVNMETEIMKKTKALKMVTKEIEEAKARGEVMSEEQLTAMEKAVKEYLVESRKQEDEALAKTMEKNSKFDEGCSILQKEAINKIVYSFEFGDQIIFTSEDYMRFHTIVYDNCVSYPDFIEAQRLYDKYKSTFQDYISFKVLPSLQGKKDAILLQELVKHWENHKIMTHWLSRFFYHLETFFARKRKLPTLQQSSHLIFYGLVYGEFNNQVTDAVISLINKEREGEQIDQALLKSVVDIYVRMGEDSVNCYQEDFEEAMLKDSAAFYSRKASDWIAYDSYKDYMLKVEESKNHEKNRVSSYMRYDSEDKLLQVVEKELLTVHEGKLAEKKLLQESIKHIEGWTLV